VGALLNSDFDGGDFKIYTPQETTLTKNAGNAYVFDVTYEHEITRITNGIKYSIIWFVQDNHIKIKQLSII
jgi:predicted 2-oxoglutarate/Fe(II)-dependent dioxygenase YbiX